MFEPLERAFTALFIFAVSSMLIAWPLAIWKAVEIILWITSHLSVSWQ